MAAARETKLVYDFTEGSREMRELLGGKGANVAEMTRILGAERVPAGFTITTEACVAYMEAGREEPPTGSRSRWPRRSARLEEQAGKRLGRPERPAARVRALRRARVDAGDAGHGPQPGARTTSRSRAWRAATGNERFAWDSYRRFVQMFGNVCRGVAGRALRGRDQGAEAEGAA